MPSQKCFSCKEVRSQFNFVLDSQSNPYCCYCATYYLFSIQSNSLVEIGSSDFYLMSEDSDTIYFFRKALNPKITPPYQLGCSGSWWKIETYNGNIYYTNNMWCVGDKSKIPPKFVNNIKSNVKSIECSYSFIG